MNADQIKLNTSPPSEAFAFGGYGDWSGVSFYGPPEKGFWLDRLDISDRFIDPIFSAILSKSEKQELPQVIKDWCELSAWCDVGGEILELSSKETNDLIYALSSLDKDDLELIGDRTESVDDCLACIIEILKFFQGHQQKGKPIFIEEA